jgi:hypothetical protein
MQKIKLKSPPIYDISYFDLIYEHVEIKPCRFEDIITFDDYIPVVNSNVLLKNDHITRLRNYLNSNPHAKIIFLDSHEGGPIVMEFLQEHELVKFCDSKQMILITSSDFQDSWLHINVDDFINKTGSLYNRLAAANTFEKIFETKNKPYAFLFLNNLSRLHRTKLIEWFKNSNLLDTALWSNRSAGIELPEKYNDYYRKSPEEINLKIFNTVHDASYTDPMLIPALYVDTYFSVVTETNYYMPYRYCTEKIYKPLLMGHPFVAVSSYGFYQQLKDQGYKTFNGLIDESFDTIADDHLRLVKTYESIKELCRQNLDDFLDAAKSICDYNRTLFLEKISKQEMNNYYKLKNLLTTISNAKNI